MKKRVKFSRLHFKFTLEFALFFIVLAVAIFFYFSNKFEEETLEHFRFKAEVISSFLEQNPETFWEKFYWSDLTPAEQELWGKLGWDKDSWDEKAPPPRTEDMGWSELSPVERNAAKQLGYNSFYWDSN